MSESQTTEQKIIEAAKVEFLAHGMAGARMQRIADRAGINKAMLHYYFRSKEKLFEIIFQKVFFKLIPQLNEVFDSTDDFFMIIRKFVSVYIQTIGANSFFAPFMAHEINREPERLIALLEKHSGGNFPFEKMANAFQKAILEGRIKPVAPDMLLVNILSMCVFPFIGKPIIQHVLQKDDKAFDDFIERRKVEVAEFVINAIKA